MALNERKGGANVGENKKETGSSGSVCAKTRKECKEKLAVMIEEVKTEIAKQKEKLQ